MATRTGNSKRKPRKKTSGQGVKASRARSTAAKTRPSKRTTPKPPRVLVVDVGGTNVKLLATGESEPRRLPSGDDLSPAAMVSAVRKRTQDWKYDVVSIGYPGPVGVHGPRSEPGNLGGGWVGFDFAAAFERPVRIINDAAMQALGSYEGGRMLFLGFGTGLGSALIAENVIIPLELGKLVYDKDESLGALLGRKGLKALGQSGWRKIVDTVLESFVDAVMVDYVVIGGGYA